MGEADTQPGGYVGPDHVGEEILCVDNLSFAFPDGVVALEDVSFHLQKGATLAVIGRFSKVQPSISTPAIRRTRMVRSIPTNGHWMMARVLRVLRRNENTLKMACSR